MELHAYGITDSWNYIPHGITHWWNYTTHGITCPWNQLQTRGAASDQGHETMPRHSETPSTDLKKKSESVSRGHRAATHLPAPSAAEDLPHKSQQKDARQQPQCRRRIRLGVRRGSCHSPRSFGGILPPSRQIGLPPCLGRSVGRVSRSYDLRVVRGNFQQVSIELFGCRPFREGCLLIRHAVFLCGCGGNVGK